MSAPAANAFSLPVMTMQPMPSSASKPRQRAAELVHQRVVERVELLGPVQRDQCHVERAGCSGVSRGGDELVVHRSSFWRCRQVRESWKLYAGAAAA